MPATAPTFTAYDGVELPLDLAGFPYRETEHLGAVRMTLCCGAACSAGDLGLYCKRCYGAVDFEVDGLALLSIDEQPDACPACGHDEVSCFAAAEDREDEADIVECVRCRWTAALTPEGAASLAG